MLGLYKALYDYAPQDPETELALEEGQVVYVLDKEDAEWWKARVKATEGGDDGPVGLVPSNYVEEAAPLYRARAIYAYASTSDEELSMAEDDLLHVFEKDDEWVLVKLVDGAEGVGYVPASYVQEEEGTAGEEGFNGDAVQEIDGPPQAAYVDPAELAAERRDKSKADSIQTWVVSELDGKKKKKGTLGVGNGAIFFASESSKSPIQQHPISDVDAVSVDGKDVVVRLVSVDRPWTFHCASNAEATDVHAKLVDSKDLSGGSFEAAAAAHDEDAAPTNGGLSVSTQSAPKAVRWAPSPTSPMSAPAADDDDDDEPVAVAMYDFEAEGGADELRVSEGEALVVVDRSDEGWWKVRNARGQEGVVPAAFVEIGGSAPERADDQDDEEEEERRREAAAAEEAAIVAANEQRQRDEAERSRQAEERRLRQEAEEKRRRKDEERARRDEEARRREEARRQAPAPEPPKIRSRPSMNDIPQSIPHKSGLPSRPQESSSSRTLPSQNRIRTWHDKSGQFKVEAEFLGFKGGKIRLHKVNGVVIEVPLAKMSPEDCDYIDRVTAKQRAQPPARRPTNDDDLPLAQSPHANKGRPTTQVQSRSAVAQPSSRPPPQQQQRRKPTFDWFEFFLNAGVDVDDCTRYSTNFDRDKIDETILDDLEPSTLRSLGLREGDVIRVRKAIAARKTPKEPKSSQMESDEALARRLQEEENSGRSGGSGLFTSSDGGLKNQTRRGRPERKGTAPDAVDASSVAAASSSLARNETPPVVAVSPPPVAISNPVRTTSAAPPAIVAPTPASSGFDDDAWTPRPSSTKPATPTPTPPPTVPAPPALVSFDSATSVPRPSTTGTQTAPQAASSMFESLAQPGQYRPPSAPLASPQQPLNTGMSNLSIGSNNTGSSLNAPQSYHNGLGFGGSSANMGQLLQAQQTGMFQQPQQQGARQPPQPVPANQGLLNPLVPTQTGLNQFVPTRSSANGSPFQNMQPQQTGFVPQQQTGFVQSQQTGFPNNGFQSTPSYLPPQNTAVNTNFQAGQVMANQNALSSADQFNQLASARPQPAPSQQPSNFNPSNVFAAMKNNKGVLDSSAAPQGADKYDALRPQATGFPGMMQQPQMTGFPQQQQQPMGGFMPSQQTGFPIQQQQQMPMQPSFMGPQATGFMPPQQTGFNPYGQQQQQGYRGF